MVYRVKDAKYINGLFILAITIDGNGEGLRNNIILRDENENEYFIKSIAMTCGNMKETTLIVSLILQKGEIGKNLYLKGIIEGVIK